MEQKYGSSGSDWNDNPNLGLPEADPSGDDYERLHQLPTFDDESPAAGRYPPQTDWGISEDGLDVHR
jgi:hypothetical protein